MLCWPDGRHQNMWLSDPWHVDVGGYGGEAFLLPGFKLLGPLVHLLRRPRCFEALGGVGIGAVHPPLDDQHVRLFLILSPDFHR